VVGRSATPSPSLCNLLVQGGWLNLQLVAYILALPALLVDVGWRHWSVCVLLPSIKISRVMAPAWYRRRSLSNDIVGMCGWRSILRYWLIDIIPRHSACLKACTLQTPPKYMPYKFAKESLATLQSYHAKCTGLNTSEMSNDCIATDRIF